MKVLIVSTGHWSGDPRLNRHLRYLNSAGYQAAVVAFESNSRPQRLINMFRAIRKIWNEVPAVVILPDPELIVPGSLVARLRGIRVVVDVHEDYVKAVTARAWIPGWIKPLARLLVGLNDKFGRQLADAVVVAAPQLKRGSDVLVMNIPDPDDFKQYNGYPGEMATAVYIGDVTEARGGIEIAEIASRLPEIKFLVIGRIGEPLKNKMVERAGPTSQLEFTGQLPHAEAWELARGSVAGLSLLRPVPAYMEAVATKLWEYAAAGIPPVVSELPGQRQFVEEIDPSLAGSNSEVLAGIVKRLATEGDFRQRLADRSREKAQSGWDRFRPDLAIVEAVSPDR